MRRLVYAAPALVLLLLPATAFASLGVESTFIRLLTAGGPTGNERILWSGKFTILPDTNGISPRTEDLVFTLESFEPDPASPDGGAFVQQYSALVPAGELTSADGGLTWSLVPDATTTLETLDVTAVPGAFMVDLLDRHASLPEVDYDTVRVTLAIGDDSGSAVSAMFTEGNQWLIAPAPAAGAPIPPE